MVVCMCVWPKRFSTWRSATPVGYPVSPASTDHLHQRPLLYWVADLQSTMDSWVVELVKLRAISSYVVSSCFVSTSLIYLFCGLTRFWRGVHHGSGDYGILHKNCLPGTEWEWRACQGNQGNHLFELSHIVHCWDWTTNLLVSSWPALPPEL